MLARLTRNHRLVLILAVAVFLAYYGLPAAFLKSPVQSHLQNRYGLLVNLGSVRVSVRGLVVSDVSAVWPDRQATLSMKELTIGISAIKSIRRRRPVFERLKLVFPVVTIRLPELDPAGRAAANLGIMQRDAGSPGRIPDSFDIKIRRGKVHLFRGAAAAIMYPIDAVLERDEPGRLAVRLDIQSPEMGRLTLRMEQGRTAICRLDHIHLSTVSRLLGSPQELEGYLTATLEKDGPAVSGSMRVEGLVWRGPRLSATLETDPAPIDTAAPHAASFETGTPTPDTDILVLSTAIKIPDTPVFDTQSIVPAHYEAFIYPPLDVEISGQADLTPAGVLVREALLSIGGVSIQAEGKLTRQWPPEVDLEFYARDFDEPSLERISGHFRVLRYVHTFLRTIQSPSRLQAKMSLRGPLTQPMNWRYDGLIDIRRDLFSYEPFLGQYSFLGTVVFDRAGVRIPEILMPLGEENLVLAGVAADYASRRSHLTLRGRNLSIGPMLRFYTPEQFRPADTRPAGMPSGLADVDLVLERSDLDWNLTGGVQLRQVVLPLTITDAPARAYGRMKFSDQGGDGQIRFKLGGLETEIRPYARGLFTTSAEMGIQLKDPAIQWERVSKSLAAAADAPFLPQSGGADISLKVFRRLDPSATGAAERLILAETDQAQIPWLVNGAVEYQQVRFFLPQFSVPVDSASGVLIFEDNQVRIDHARGFLAGSSITASGTRPIGPEGRWDLAFRSPDLNLGSLLASIKPPGAPARPSPPYEIRASAEVQKLRYHTFEIPAVSGRFVMAPGRFRLDIDTPIVTEYVSTDSPKPWSELKFTTAYAYPLKKLFAPGAALDGSVSGRVALRGRTLGDSQTAGGEMELDLDRLTFKRAPFLLTVLDLMRLSLTDVITFDPIRFVSTIERGAVRLDQSCPSNVGLWKFRGRLGLDATFRPESASDSGFHTTLFPKENILTKILHESKILAPFAGRQESMKLDFFLIGNYNNPNILWTEEPIVSIIRGRVSELVPGIFSTSGNPDTERERSKERISPGDTP